MDGISAAASIIAVAELAAKAVHLCVEYSINVKNASKDISCLQSSLESLSETLKQAQKLYTKTESDDPSASENTLKCLTSCRGQLEDLLVKLKISSEPRSTIKAKLRLLKWPLKQKELEKRVQSLNDSKQSLSLAIQLDEINILKNIKYKFDAIQLPIAEGASFNSYSEQQNAKCHQETRISLRQQTREWIRNSDAKCIFWLSGMAGTGKSTIARSLAQESFDHRQLGASFFFRRGEATRGNASRFVTTIASQLTRHAPSLQEHIGKAIDANPSVSTMTLEDQFQVLVLQPLHAVSDNMQPLLIVIDAVDEVGSEVEMCLILSLLQKLAHVRSTVRVFLTSRPELSIRKFFEKASDDFHQHVILEEISDSLTRHDIEVYLKDELAAIREKSEQKLALDWPGQQRLDAITDIAQPLFVAAATILRFVGDVRFDPEEQLQVILEEPLIDNTDHLSQSYRLVITRMLSDLSQPQKIKMLKEFRHIVGAIVLLADPLPVHALANLLDETEQLVRRRLNSLHAVLTVPLDLESPVRMLHLSFRDFLTSSLHSNEDYWIDEALTHRYLADACLKLLSSTARLKQNICGIEKAHAHRRDISDHLIKQHIPSEIHYACRYWAFHLHEAQSSIIDQGSAHKFLLKYFLHWIEVLILVDAWNEIPSTLKSLQKLCNTDNSSACKALLEDGMSFFAATKDMLNLYPLQLYSSALVFTSDKNLISRLYEKYIPDWIKMLPLEKDAWADPTSNPDVHTSNILNVAISSDGQLLATTSQDNTIKLWSRTNGILRCTIWVARSPLFLIFSRCGRHIVAFMDDGTIRIWDVENGKLERTINDFLGELEIASSSDGRLVANDTLRNDSMTIKKTVQIWDMINYKQSCIMLTETLVRKMRFSSNCDILAVGDAKGMVWLIHVNSQNVLLCLRPTNQKSVLDVRFSSDDERLAVFQGASVSVWTVPGGVKISEFWIGHAMSIAMPYTADFWKGSILQFSRCRKYLFFAGRCSPLQVLDLRQRCLLKAFPDLLGPFALSPDGSRIASYNENKSITVASLETGYEDQTLLISSPVPQSIEWLTDNENLLIHTEKSVELWDLNTNTCKFKIQALSTQLSRVEFVADGRLAALFSDPDRVQIWNVEKNMLQCELSSVSNLISCFSNNGKWLAAYISSKRNRVELVDIVSRTTVHVIDLIGALSWVKFSPDDRYLACRLTDGLISIFDTLIQTTIQIPDVNHPIHLSENIRESLDLPEEVVPVQNLIFSSDSQQIALSYSLPFIQVVDLVKSSVDQFTINDKGLFFPDISKINVETYFADSEKILCTDLVTPFVFELRTHRIHKLIPEMLPVDHCNTIISRDNKYVAICLQKTAIQVRETLADWRQTADSIHSDEQINELAFNSDATYLETDRGPVRTMIKPNKPNTDYRYRIWIKDQWMQIDSQRALWLPPRARPQLRKFCKGKMLVAYSSGLVGIFDCKTGTRQILSNASSTSR